MMNEWLVGVLFAGALGWLAFWIGVSVLIRRRLSKPIIPRAPANASFAETGCSGRSLANAITSIGGARNCLLIYVANGELVVMPTFPFTLMFLSEIFGLELRASIKEIEARLEDGLFGQVVRIDFRARSRPSFELRLQDVDGLLRTLEGEPNLAGPGRASAGSKPAWRYGPRAILFGIFLLLWGGVGFTVGLSGLRVDLDFMVHGTVTRGTIIGSTDADHAIVRYAVDGTSYTIESLLGPGTYKVGGTEVVRYMPGRPDIGREQVSFSFYLVWVIAGAAAIAIALTLGLWPWIKARHRR